MMWSLDGGCLLAVLLEQAGCGWVQLDRRRSALTACSVPAAVCQRGAPPPKERPQLSLAAEASGAAAVGAGMIFGKRLQAAEDQTGNYTASAWTFEMKRVWIGSGPGEQRGQEILLGRNE